MMKDFRDMENITSKATTDMHDYHCHVVDLQANSLPRTINEIKDILMHKTSILNNKEVYANGLLYMEQKHVHDFFGILEEK